MTVPIEISFRDVDARQDVDELIHTEVAKLNQFFDHIQSCRVVIEVPHRHHRSGNSYAVHVQLGVPQRELVVNHEPSGSQDKENLDTAIREAFRTLRRQLQDYVRVLRGEVKRHATPQLALET